MSDADIDANNLQTPDSSPSAWQKSRERLAAFYERHRDNPIYLSVLLGGFCLICALILASSHLATLEPIALRQKEDLQSSLAKVIPAALHDNDLVKDAYALKAADGTETMLYPAYRNGAFAAVAYQVSAVGYGGPILSLIGVDKEGSLLGTEVLMHTETPGLGDRIESSRGDWIKQFTGRSLGDPEPEKWKVKKDGGYFDQLSGATITPRAVVLSVRNGLQFFKAHQEQIVHCPKGICEEGSGS
ncbi:electron transport complex protein RnfG [Cohaesibacter marisflavi]|uniref:Ion-translocating oxidoreductase complex subunit G n=1 Tax=Cohaesibacter marisflavi TaxID=655353 RepID=A0A1I5AGP5_9HYPH|nr:RnfABCDGE type electron transport complex subunit G [Cohaesibacter marisflavi]SFN61651.1 electron transport complex protein RnfG [Cohaesibacter marisflavi]